VTERLLNLFEQTRSWSRAMQWAFWSGVFIIGFLLWSETLGALAQSWSTRADNIEQKVEKVREARDFDRQFRQIRYTIETMGPVELPSTERQSANAFNEVINDVLARHNVRNDSFELRSRGNLPRTALTDVVEPGQRVARLVGDLRFDADTETTMAIVRELESRPEIESIMSIRLMKQSGTSLSVRMELEAWVTSRGGRS